MIDTGCALESLAMRSSEAATGTRTTTQACSISTTTGLTTTTTTSASADPTLQRLDAGLTATEGSILVESIPQVTAKARQQAKPKTAAAPTGAVVGCGKKVIGTATLYNCDCMEYMRQVPDGYFNLAIVDPPYFEGVNKSGYYGKGYSSLGVQRAKHYDSLDSWDIPNKQYFDELARISKNQIIWGANHFAGVFDSSSAGWIVWDKDNGKSSFSDGELAYSSFDRALRIFKWVWNGMHQGSYGGNVKLNQKRIHPTQKPIELYEWVLQNYAKDGDKIFDSHSGSGSHAIACNRLGFELHGTEIDKTMFDKSCEWIQQELKQARMFA